VQDVTSRRATCGRPVRCAARQPASSTVSRRWQRGGDVPSSWTRERASLQPRSGAPSLVARSALDANIASAVAVLRVRCAALAWGPWRGRPGQRGRCS
jgi:hypothetical protein